METKINRAAGKLGSRIDDLEQDINNLDWSKKQFDRKFEQVNDGLDRVDAKIQRLRQELENDEPKGYSRDGGSRSVTASGELK